MSTAPRSRVRLEDGDRMSREEFHRRYCRRPDLKKGELIEGVVFVPSPTPYRVHGVPHGVIASWLGTYAATAPGVEMALEATVKLDDDNEVQPDAILRHTSQISGASRLGDDDYLEGPPQLVAEVSASSATRDMRGKLTAYQRNGVLEYVVWLTLEGRLEWLRLQDGRFIPVEPDEHGVIESAVFPGLRLHVAALLAGDYARVLSTQTSAPR